jgi:hypothetical protein
VIGDRLSTFGDVRHSTFTGSVLSIWAARVLSGVGFGADRFDTLSIGMPATVLIIAGAAAVLPASRRAARTDPLITRRSELSI